MKEFLKRHLLLFGFLAVLGPLAVLLVLQYRWLLELQEKTAIAREATLGDYLETVSSAVESYYRLSAERLLAVPADLFTTNRLDEVADVFEERGTKGAKRVFVLSFVTTDAGKLLFYDPSIPSMEPPNDPEEARAAYVASAPWQILGGRPADAGAAGVSVDEMDRQNRILLCPVFDEGHRVVGVAGMILDEEFFRTTILPEAIRGAMSAFFTESEQERLSVRARNGRGEIILGKEPPKGQSDDAKKSLTFVFADHRLALSADYMTPREWARSGFTLNLSLAVLMALVLLGGLVLALRTASREMRLSQMKGDFVSNVSHELRTPLASIRVFGEFLRLGRVTSPEKVREYGEYIESESRRLTGLVNNILDFSKIESGRKTYEYEPTDVTDLVGRTLRTFEVGLSHEGYRIALETPREPLPDVRIDAEAISQALTNLLDNAVKYSDGSKQIEVSLARQDDSIAISVKDHGIGISRDEQRKIFDRFHRVSTGLVHDVKGSGLGLSIVDHIAKAHHGRVTVVSEPGKGSTFTLVLPIHG
ncbi:MAG TPA: HAMP domain-containing sensor histidine kinase [Candidatus Polarisedimenticolia bacterium]|nr:HAMP domain-containing sensor histidine kinase [Candidatus Polarisedimenticolia bacterium]